MSRKDFNTGWVEVEQKVPDQVPVTMASRTLTVMVKGKGKKMKQVKLRIPAEMRPEIKRAVSAAFWDGETFDNPAGTASQYQFFKDIAQGTGAFARIGDAIYIEKVVVRTVMYPSAVCMTHMAFVLDNEPAAGAPAWTTVFNGIGAASVQAYDVAIPQLDSRSRFRFLERSSAVTTFTAYWTGSSVVAQSHPTVQVFEIPIKRKVFYNNTTAAPVAGCELILFGWSRQAADTPQVTASYEIFFTDV